MIHFVPNGILLDAATVWFPLGVFPFAHIPFALGPQHSLQAQYAVIVALMMLVIILQPPALEHWHIVFQEPEPNGLSCEMSSLSLEDRTW